MTTTPQLAILLKPNAADKLTEVFDGLDVCEGTRKEYRQRVELFVSFVGRIGFNRNSVVEYKRMLARDERLSIASKNKYFTVAKVFVRELYRIGAIPADISAGIKGFRQSKLHRREGLTEEEVQAMARMMRKLPPTPYNARLRAVFALLIVQGLRQIEVTRLDVEDLRLPTGIAYIQGKGRDDKEPIYLAPQTVTALRQYLRAAGISSGVLFRSFSNRKAARLSTMTIKRDMHRLMKPLGIKKVVHGCRHYYATTILRRLNPMDARKFTRHHSLDMLLVYNDELDAKLQSREVFRCFKNVSL
jgi:integrase